MNNQGNLKYITLLTENGEGQRVAYARYYTTDVIHTGDIKKVTCLLCNEILEKLNY